MRAPSDGEWFFFDDAERRVVGEALSRVGDASPALASALAASVARLGALAAMLRDNAPIATSWRATRGADRPDEALLDLLCRVPEYDLELHIPTRAVLGQAYLVAKINLFKSFGYALEEVGAPGALRAAMESEVAQSIHSKMLEEVLLSILTSREGVRPLKVRAAQALFRVWDERLHAEVDDLAPLLESAWEARNKVRPVLGTMLGTHEVFQLLAAARDDVFVDYYTARDAVTPDETAAFEEFIFGLSHEDIAALRAHLATGRASSLSLHDAEGLLGARYDGWAASVHGPQAIYSDYRRRRMQAACRALTSAEGPKKVAEEYVLAAHLMR